MRLLRAFLLCLCCAPAALALTEEGLPLKGKFGFHERISLGKYLERENQFLIISDKTLMLIDVGSGKVLENHPTNFPWAAERKSYILRDWAISPDGGKLVIVDYPEAKDDAFARRTRGINACCVMV